ncbi:hypothetical protein [Niallia sp. BSM11]|uniref:hypothetical protein n=1 Tax=Niallia sp. BSM11 TaxID=3391576 RepID=UPI003984E129
MLSLIKYELRKYINKSLIVFFVLFLAFTYLDNFIHYQFGAAKPDLVVGSFGLSLLLTQLYLIYLASVYISSEFQIGTSKSVFTGVYTRTEIINIKMFTMLLIAICFGVINWLIGFIVEIILLDNFNLASALTDLLTVVAIYLVYFIGILTFSLFICSICLNRLMTIILSYGAFIFIGEIVAQIADRSPSFADIVENLPFYIITNGFSTLSYNLESLIIIFIFSTILYLAGIYIFKKRDLT